MMTNKLKNYINKSVNELIKDLKKDFIQYEIIERKFLGRRKYFEYYSNYYIKEKEFNILIKEFEKDLKNIKLSLFIYYKNSSPGGEIILSTQTISFKSNSIEDIIKELLERLKEEDKRNKVLNKIKDHLNILLNRNWKNFDIVLDFTIYSNNSIKSKSGFINRCNILFTKHYRFEDLF